MTVWALLQIKRPLKLVSKIILRFLKHFESDEKNFTITDWTISFKASYFRLKLFLPNLTDFKTKQEILGSIQDCKLRSGY